MENALSSAFSEAIQKVLSNIAQVNLRPFEHAPDSDSPLPSFINGNVGLTGAARVSVTVCFSKEAIYEIHRSLFPDDDASDITVSSLGDLVGEITNMISGQARGKLSENGLKFDSSLPTVIIGERQHIHVPQGTIAKILPFSFDGNTVYLELVIEI